MLKSRKTCRVRRLVAVLVLSSLLRHAEHGPDLRPGTTCLASRSNGCVEILFDVLAQIHEFDNDLKHLRVNATQFARIDYGVITPTIRGAPGSGAPGRNRTGDTV